MKEYDIIVIGAGAAGLMAAITAAEKDCFVCLLEKNEKPGKKIYITGKGRCNITNACDTEDLFQHVVTNSKFLYSSFYTLTNHDVIRFFEESGCPTKTERGNRVFPVSDKSSDVIRTLWDECRRNKVEIRFHTVAEKVNCEDSGLWGVVLSDGTKIAAKSVIIATGGLSYPSTGSDGDGYRFAKAAGHVVEPCRPSLVPLNIKEKTPARMQGLSLKNVELSFFVQNKKGEKKELYREFGEMMFTHFGITGPVVLSASCYIGAYVGTDSVFVSLDCKPALNKEKLHRRILRDFEATPNAGLKQVLRSLLPKSMIPVLIGLCGLDGTKPVNQVTRQERENLVNEIKEMVFTVDSLRGWNEAVITRGGVNVRQVNPSTMESKLAERLYFAGEVLDVDAVTGGFNLQIAWSTGYLAGLSAANHVKSAAL